MKVTVHSNISDDATVHHHKIIDPERWMESLWALSEVTMYTYWEPSAKDNFQSCLYSTGAISS